MAIIGTFTRQDKGSYTGSIDTLTLKERMPALHLQPLLVPDQVLLDGEVVEL